jgi:hypothetical protein
MFSRGPRIGAACVPFQLQPFNKKALLIGAGFSRNWGGRLAREMWEDIFSNRAVQARAATRGLMLRNPLFEDALAEVLDTKLYSDDDCAAINTAVQDVFERMDLEHSAQLGSGRPSIDLGGMKNLIARFRAQAHDNVGYVFSLNQDVLFERLVSHWPDIQCWLPGVRALPDATPLLGIPSLANSATSDLSNVRLDGAINYCKLHGSFRWHPTQATFGYSSSATALATPTLTKSSPPPFKATELSYSCGIQPIRWSLSPM